MYYSYKARLRNLANKELKVTSFSSDSLLQEHEKGLTAGFELYTKRDSGAAVLLISQAVHSLKNDVKNLAMLSSTSNDGYHPSAYTEHVNSNHFFKIP